MSSTTTTTTLANAPAKKQTKPRAKKIVETKPVENEVVENEIVENPTNQPENEIVEPVETKHDEVEVEDEVEDEEIDEVEELRKKLAEAENRKREKETRKKIVELRESHTEFLQKQQSDIDEKIKRLLADREQLDTEIVATKKGENDDLLVKLTLQKTSVAPKTIYKKVSGCITGETEKKQKTLKPRPELYEICSKKTTFKYAWSKDAVYTATYDPEKRVLTWNGNEFKNLNDWINGSKVAGNSIADTRNQKSSAKNAWERNKLKLVKDNGEEIDGDTILRGCGILN